MTSADFLAHRIRIYSKISPGKGIFLPPISTGSTWQVHDGFPPLGRQYDVLPHPTYLASVSSSCSLEPGFAVSLPSLHASQQTSLRLASASGRYPRTQGTFTLWNNLVSSIPDAHAGHTHCISVMRAKVLNWSDMNIYKHKAKRKNEVLLIPHYAYTLPL